jgi:hypothetical protein
MEVKTSGTSTKKANGSVSVKPDAAAPNANIDLSAFDYNKFAPETPQDAEASAAMFKEYQALVNNLNVHESRDFVQYMASGVFKTVLNDNADKVVVLVGIKINNIKPVNTTRIPVGMAKNLNEQIMNRDNPASNSRYYLLKKPE